jgi:23S rRNA G2445 N2-methylase RlmL
MVEPLFADAEPLVVASDIDSRAVEMTETNARAAGVEERIATVHSDVRNLSERVLARRVGERWREDGSILVISNPPYGERLAGGELDLYYDLGQWCRSLSNWRAAFLVANPDFEEAFGGRARVKKPLSNGPLRGYFYLFDE